MESRAPKLALTPIALAAAIVLGACPQPARVECGGEAQRCCADAACSLGLECGVDDVCRACGGAGQPCCASASCAALLSCGPGGTCRACGGDGQVCCDQDHCSAGAECRVDGVCYSCGGSGQSCCSSGAPCSSGLRCDNSSCVTPCGAACAPGEKRCSSSGGVDLCLYQGPPCTAWGPLLEECPSGQICDQGSCKVRCATSCEPGSMLCTSEGLKICALDPSTQCPTLELAPDLPDNPSCMTGACDGAICWENPMPQGNPLQGIVGWYADQFLVLDDLGNILRRNGQAWEYSYRTAARDRAFLGIGLCMIGRAVAVGRGGSAARQVHLGWTNWDLGDTTVNLNAVGCAPAFPGSVVIAAGDGGKAYVRGAEEASWRPLVTGVSKSLRGVYAFSGQTWEAFLVGDGGTVLHCKDLSTQSPSCSPEAVGLTTANLSAVWAGTRASPVVAVGAGGTVLERGPQGNWFIAARGALAQDLTSVHGRDDGRVFVTGAHGAFAYRETIGTWQSPSFTEENLTGVLSVDADNLYVVSEEGTVWFNDIDGDTGPQPGNRWRPFGPLHPQHPYLRSASGTDVSNVYSVGDQGAIFHRSGDVWLAEAKGLTTADLSGVFAVSADEVYAVGSRGTLLARSNGVWAVEGAGITATDLNGVFSDGTTVYAVGAGTWLERPTGVSGQWSRLTPPTSAPLLAITGKPDGSEVWAAGFACTVLRKASGHFSLESVPGCNGDSFFSAWESPEGDLYLGTDFGTLFHKRADVWSLEFLGGNPEIVSSITGFGSDVFASCLDLTLYHRTAGSWRSEAMNLTSHYVNSLWAAPGGNVYAVGGNGLVWHRR